MENVESWLRQMVTDFFYPALAIGILIYIGVAIIAIVRRSSGASAIRRLVGALLPVIILIFAMVAESERSFPLTSYIARIEFWYDMGLGVMIGATAFLLRKLLSRRNADRIASLDTLFLSALGVFILYFIIQNALWILAPILFGMVICFGLFVILFG